MHTDTTGNKNIAETVMNIKYKTKSPQRQRENILLFITLLNSASSRLCDEYFSGGLDNAK